MTSGFPSGAKNFFELLCVSCEVFVLHGYAWIHWVAKSCTMIAYRWLFRDLQLSLRTLWSAVIKSPKFTARGTASPLLLLQGALVILVRLQISQFRSLGKWVWTLCLPNSSRLMLIGSKEASWDELAWEPPVTEFHHPPSSLWIVAAIPESQNLTSCPVLSWSLFYLVFGFCWLGFPQVSLIYHQPI